MDNNFKDDARKLSDESQENQYDTLTVTNKDTGKEETFYLITKIRMRNSKSDCDYIAVSPTNPAEDDDCAVLFLKVHYIPDSEGGVEFLPVNEEMSLHLFHELIKSNQNPYQQ